jgi:hypothetical protein
MAEKQFEKLLKEEFKDQWPVIESFLFENPDSPFEQSGLFKVLCSPVCFTPLACLMPRLLMLLLMPILTLLCFLSIFMSKARRRLAELVL